MVHLSHTRAGFRVAGAAFWGRFGAFWAAVSVKRSFSGRSAGIWGAFWRVLARFPVRAGAGVPLPFFARAQPQRVYPLIVYGGGIRESECVWGKVSECKWA